MTGQPGDLSLLQDPVAQELLSSQELARLAYTWTDGTPRVVPIWFHWTGKALTSGTPAKAPKLKALDRDGRVAVTIHESASWPYRALLLRGDAGVEVLDDVTEEYAAAARRYFGDEQGDAWVSQLTPTWATVLDFQTRFPSALST